MGISSYVGENVLVTTSGWFIAPDGKQYRAAWGKLYGVWESKDTLGFTPRGTHTNWYIEVGNMTIAGCQVLYVIKTDEVNTSPVDDYLTSNETGITNYNRPTLIYLAN